MRSRNPEGNFSWARKVVDGLYKATRMGSRARNNLGVITRNCDKDQFRYRNPMLEKFDAYYENRQYDGLVPWDYVSDHHEQHVPIRHRKPRIRVPLAKNVSQRITAKLIGKSVFPEVTIEDAPDDQAYFRAVVNSAELRSRLLEPTRRMVNTGAIFVRFWIEDGAYQLKSYDAKFCYPTFTANGDLEELEVKFVYADSEDLDSYGNPKLKWYRFVVGNMAEILYDNPLFEEGVEPQFEEVERVEHNMGFVQGEWMKTVDDESPDGYGVAEDLMEVTDEMSYSLSQTSQAIGYNQDPQLVINKMNEDEVADFVRSVTKSWNLGREGEAKFLEAGLGGVQRAMESRDKLKQLTQDIARVAILDPEKMVASAQSGEAMKVLHGPMKDLIDELRLPFEKSYRRLVWKMGVATFVANSRAMPVPIVIPPGFKFTSLELAIEWPEIFQQTIEDLQKKIAAAGSAKNQGLIAPITAIKFIAKDFGVEDIDAELKAIQEAKAAEAALNPFGGF